MATWFVLLSLCAQFISCQVSSTSCGAVLATPSPSKAICGKYGTLTAPASPGSTNAISPAACAEMCLAWSQCQAIGYRDDNRICSMYTKNLASQGFRTVTSGMPTNAATMYARACYTSTCITQTTSTPTPSPSVVPLPVGPCPLKVFYSDNQAFVGKYVRQGNAAQQKVASIFADVVNKTKATPFVVDQMHNLKSGARIAMQGIAASNLSTGYKDGNGNQIAYGPIELTPNALATGKHAVNCSVIDTVFNGKSVPKSLYCTNFNRMLEDMSMNSTKQLGLGSGVPQGQSQVLLQFDCS